MNDDLFVHWDLGLVKIEQMEDGQSARWNIKEVDFFWRKGVLFMVGLGIAMPMAKVPDRNGAVQWSLGFVAGRELPPLTNEPIKIVGG